MGSHFTEASCIKTLLSLLILLVFSFITAEEEATQNEISKGSPVVYSKDEFVQKFIEATGLAEAYNAKIESAELDYDIVTAQYFPRLKLIFGIGPHPHYTYEKSAILPDGDNDGLPEVKESKWHKYYDNYGVAIRAKGEFVLPLYTFGKFRTGRNAAKAQIEVRRAEAEIAKLRIRKEAAFFYWSYVMAKSYFSILEPAMEQLDKAEEKLKEMLFNGAEGVSQKHLKKLQIEKQKIQYQYERLQYQTETLREAISEVLGDNWELADTEMVQQKFDKSLESLSENLKESSPQLRYASGGLKAYESLYDLEFRKALPDFGIYGDYSFRYTSSVDETDNPNANSPYNGFDGEIGIGILFDLNILEQARKIKKAKAEWNAVKAKVVFAEKNMPLQLKQKFNDLKSLESHVAHMKQIRKITKGVMTSEYSNYESGMTTDMKDLIDAVKDFFENEQAFIQAMFDYNMKVEEIIEFTGAE